MGSDSAHSNGGDLPPEVVEDLLADERRRAALAVLRDASEPVVIGDLAAAVLSRETGESASALARERVVDVREEFFQRHLPKLTATGVVEYDSLVGTVALVEDGPVGERLDAA
ncbi:MAG: hypothetical protein ABEJ89_09915 [Haloarculaceae archaeon]